MESFGFSDITVVLLVGLINLVFGSFVGYSAGKIIRKMNIDRENIRKDARLAIENTKKLNRQIVGLGARWGNQSENAFREGMAGILSEYGFNVEKFREVDDSGIVIGHPCEIEIDVVVKNGTTFLVEIRSSITDWDVFRLENTARFYESKSTQKADKIAIISPYIDQRAKDAAAGLGITLYTDSSDFAEQYS